jgi:hypothetical protein
MPRRFPIPLYPPPEPARDLLLDPVIIPCPWQATFSPLLKLVPPLNPRVNQGGGSGQTVPEVCTPERILRVVPLRSR